MTPAACVALAYWVNTCWAPLYAGAPRVVLFGDSRAAQWFPALLGWAEESGMAVESHTKSSCAATMAKPVLNGVEYWQCEAWRA